MSFFCGFAVVYSGPMGSKSWVRARTYEQVESRVDTIRTAARRLLEHNRFDEISLVMIAKEASFTRSNLYRYFATRQEVFLDLLNHDLTAWVDRLGTWLTPGSLTIEEFAARWIDSLLEEPQMLGLLAILGTKLEAGSSVKALAEFKRQMTVIHRREIDTLMAAFPELTARKAHTLILFRSSLIVGAFPAMQPTPKQIEAMAEARIEFNPREYRDTMVAGVEVFTRSLMKTGADPRRESS